MVESNMLHQLLLLLKKIRLIFNWDTIAVWEIIISSAAQFVGLLTYNEVNSLY